MRSALFSSAFRLVLVASLAGALQALVLEPKVEDIGSKYQAFKQSNAANEASSMNAYPGNNNYGNITYDENHEDENRIILSEPYKTLLKTTARFAVAQSSLTDYVTLDTLMDVVGGASYALSKPSILTKALKAFVVAIVTILTGAFIVPASIIQSLGETFKSPERLLKLEKHLPRGLREMGIIKLVHEKTDDFLTRLKLNDSSCREQTVCHMGELVRCSFPRVSNLTIDFMSESFSRPKYKSNKYLNAFLVGFVDTNCANTYDNENFAPESCAGCFIKSLMVCPPAPKPRNARSSSQPLTPSRAKD